MTTQPTTETTAVAPAPLRPVPTGYAAPVQACPAELFDGWAMHSAALHRSMTTLLFPGQAMMAYYGDDHTTGAAFAHSVPNQTWLSSATLLQDKRVRRDVLEAAGVPVPRGRAFGLKRGLPFAREFAEEIGYPVVVKPMIGESTVEVIPAVEDERQLDHAVEYLRTVPTLRPDFTTSSYAFTQILTPKTGSSTRTRSTYRYLVEEHVSGQYVRLLLVEGELLSAVLAPRGPWQSDESAEEVTADLHPDLRAFATEVWKALPGLTVLMADIVVDDFRASLTEKNRAIVVEVSERPWLHLHRAASDALPLALAQRILETSSPVPLREDVGSSPIKATFRWDGISQIDTDIDRAAVAARALGADLTVSSADAVTGIVTGAIVGTPRAIALLNELLIEGDVLVSPAMCVETRPHTAPTA